MKSILLLLAVAMPVFGEMTGQPQAILTHGAGDTVNLDWQGLAARSYFLQYSEDLQTWNYFPLVESGSDAPISYGFSSTADKFFVRLQYTDEPTDDPENADFDGDGLTNLEEISIYHTKPFASDSDGDGMSDGYEVQNGLDPNDDGSIDPSNGAYGDLDQDGVANAVEMAEGTDPQSAESFPPSMMMQSRTAYAHREDGPSGVSGEFSAFRNWTATPFSQNDFSALTAASVLSRLDNKFPFEDKPSDSATTKLVLPTVYRPLGLAGFGQYAYPTGGTQVQGYLLQTRVWVTAPKKATPQTFKFLKRDEYSDEVSSGAFGYGYLISPTVTKGTPSIETFTIPANETVSNSVDVNPAGTLTNGRHQWTSTELYTVSIVPDTGMAGVVGDMIPSNKTENPELHFVSPKKTDEINDEYVVFTATGISAAEITANDAFQIMEWSGGEAVPNEPLKRRVKRDFAKKETIEIKLKNGGQSVVKLNVWIVWATIGAPSNYNMTGNASFVQKTGSISYEVDPVNNCNFLFTISPSDLFVDSIDRPVLEGVSSKPVPGKSKAYDLHPNYGDADTAALKWDVSRQAETIVCNPNGILRGVLGAPSKWFARQPAAQGDAIVAVDVAAPFPTNPVEGNDDPFLPLGGVDEDDDPYESNMNAGFIHHKGQIGSADTPKAGIYNSMGQDGYKFGMVSNFKEFARLQLWNDKRVEGRFWFRISDYKDWHFSMHVKFDGNTQKWQQDSDTSIGLGLDNPQ